jgi:hypothetical protein
LDGSGSQHKQQLSRTQKSAAIEADETTDVLGTRHPTSINFGLLIETIQLWFFCRGV